MQSGDKTRIFSKSHNNKKKIKLYINHQMWCRREAVRWRKAGVNKHLKTLTLILSYLKLLPIILLKKYLMIMSENHFFEDSSSKPCGATVHHHNNSFMSFIFSWTTQMSLFKVEMRTNFYCAVFWLKFNFF